MLIHHRLGLPVRGALRAAVSVPAPWSARGPSRRRAARAAPALPRYWCGRLLVTKGAIAVVVADAGPAVLDKSPHRSILQALTKMIEG